jgi:PAS domain S-box-containing protein
MDPRHEIASALDRRSMLPLIRGLARLHDSMALIDDRGRVVWMSEGLVALCEEPQQFRGRRWVELLFDASDAERLFEELCRVGYLANEPVSIRSRDGRPVDVKLSAARLGDADSSWATITITRPAPHTRKIGAQSPGKLAHLRAILESSPEGVLVIDLEGRIRYANPAAGELLGCRATELVDSPVDRFVQDRQELDRIAAALLPDCPVRGRDLHLRRRDSTRICVSVSASWLHLPDGTRKEVVAYLRDVTERRRFEEELARANAQLEHYVDAVSHDLRSPLVSLLGFSRLLREDYGVRLGDKGRHFLDRIEQAGRTMEQLIHDLLELSRIGRTDEPRALVDPRSVLAQLCAEFKPRLDQAGASFEIPEQTPLLTCNRTRLYQLFSNLIGNALEHMGEVEQPVIRVELQTLEDVHQITVSDNGKGIEPTQQARIFEIFQSFGSRKDGRQGTGIGLAIVKKIVETHGGRVWVTSEPGNGTQFHLTLPRA